MAMRWGRKLSVTEDRGQRTGVMRCVFRVCDGSGHAGRETRRHAL